MELVSKGIIIVVYYVPVYVDASTACNDLTFALGTQANGVGAIATRQWSIKVGKIKSNKIILHFSQYCTPKEQCRIIARLL